ncbi:hypothetical protein ABBQ38_013080 [Trebouxia sp. C0009 RCD-2024]
MTPLTQSQLADQEWDVVTVQLQQIRQDLAEAEQARDDAQVAFLRELVLLLYEKRSLIVKENVAYLRAQQAGIKIPDVEAEAVSGSPDTLVG